MHGILTIQQGDNVHSVRNAIDGALYTYLVSRLNSDNDKALDDLFPYYERQIQAGGQDGIMLRDQGTLDWYTVPTTFASAPEVGARRIRGLFVPEENISLQSFELGHNGQAEGSPRFETRFAAASLVEPVTYFADVPVAIYWTIYITRS